MVEAGLFSFMSLLVCGSFVSVVSVVLADTDRRWACRCVMPCGITRSSFVYESGRKAVGVTQENSGQC